MDRLRDRGTVYWVERSTLVLLVFYMFAHSIPRAWSTLNTDFPNYYMTARLAHEGYDTSRIYEWVWLQREKDHRAVDDRIIGLIPITPFSTLVMWPLTALQPLAAKHAWLLLNLALLVPLGCILRSMTGLRYQRIALVFLLSFPLHRNFLFGQFYVFLLLLIASACWAYLRELYVLAGVLVAVAAACKIFPVLFFVFFLQRRSWRALTAGVVTGLATAGTSIAVFGWNLHRTYLHEILPWTLHGEGLPPYVTSSASISSVLHFLLLREPQWNPHPWHNSPLCYSLLQPVLQMLVLAPAILLIRKNDRTRDRILLEWSALLVASLAISTIPASYHFVLIALPMCVLMARLLQGRQYRWVAILSIVYVGIGFPMPSPSKTLGLAVLFYVPRLFLMLALLCGHYLLLWRDRPVRASSRDWTHYAWAAFMCASVVLNVSSTLHRERAVRQEYAFRVPLQTQAFMQADPQSAGTEVRYIALNQSGYHLMTAEGDKAWIDPFLNDDLSFSGNSAIGSTPQVWIERALSPRSKVVDLRDLSHVVLDDAREPMLSADGQSLGFVRDYRGRGRLMVQRGFKSNSATEGALTAASLNIYEASFLSEKEYAFSAVENGGPPQIYVTDGEHSNALLSLGESRYPALSPDGRWMAYSHLEHGVWNLWIRDESSGAIRRVVDVPCNQIQSSWESDSKTLIYGTDCGRSLWFTAVARRRVIP
ncbi:putative conserved integral membrane protein [Acidisarcina polymorpha]|uniref:Putative conserved integral membrane protein n=1 Tax=Acidisarcina polymorpha TaxID=2211140 RepID=A0A2Z5G2X7_9BACT|nr:glycosyltransferase 87 family protein [Acidisarcina polymorpha]AXC13027.1 putative conserved integral membrane protein [Acidisarcina polymorpha]